MGKSYNQMTEAERRANGLGGGAGLSKVTSAAAAATGGLDQTMQGGTIAPATPEGAQAAVVPQPPPAQAAPAGANPDAAANQAVTDTYARLNALLAAQPDIDYAAKYKELMGQVEAQPTEKAPGKVQSFFAALGAPQQAPGLLSDSRNRAQSQEMEKVNKMTSLKEAILNASIQQEMQKGNTKKAMQQAEELEKLHNTQARLEREAGTADFEKRQGILQDNRVEIQKMKEDAARDRVDAMINGRKELQNLSAADQGRFQTAVMKLVTTMLTSSDTGVAGDTTARYGNLASIVDIAFNQILPQFVQAVGKTPPAAGSAGAGTAAPLSARAAAYKRMKEAETQPPKE